MSKTQKAPATRKTGTPVLVYSILFRGGGSYKVRVQPDKRRKIVH